MMALSDASSFWSTSGFVSGLAPLTLVGAAASAAAAAAPPAPATTVVSVDARETCEEDTVWCSVCGERVWLHSHATDR